ncbi:LAFE_0C11144g1_1 [Lachancea fermentati]|uniref:LAFE_0C11144g1_1 n=1 Tax=Lachancea fermentati TaxID=4955 RepID=A0A1G4MA94_LACFM|nr:LAFE_0C11144g1_1 [Lachancea fermentati]
MTVVPSFISLIDHTNKPLIVFVTKNDIKINSSLKFNILSNMALDYFESSIFDWMSINQNSPEIKSLFQMEGTSVYGKLIKQTSLKIIIGFPVKHTSIENEVTEIFHSVSRIYVQCKCNPFVETERDLITQLDKKFNEKFN